MRIRHEPASSAARTLLNRLRTNIRGYIVRGLLVIVPLGITFYVLRLCYLLTAGHLAPFVRANVVQFPPFMEPIIAVILFSSMLYLIGFLAAWVLGRRLIAIGEMLLRRIPLVKTIYTASKQAVDVLSLQDADPTYQSAVLVDFPYPGSKAMAFMTGKVALEGEGPHYRIFVPTTPNPTSGYFCIFPPRHVEPMGMGVQDAFKAIMSVGIVTPDILTPSTPLADTELRMPSTHEAADHRPAKGPVSVLGRVKHLLRTRMLSGFLVLVPLGITAFAMNLLYTFTAGRIAPLAKALPGSLPGYVTAIISVMLFFVLL
ncbi:MAG: DUF502 domain-containing protein, partial [Candidatus Hydrogenedentes bacterium]|nr:DUF502 domain-containing protein [Candidatus Hydrogenedentota bacterium]